MTATIIITMMLTAMKSHDHEHGPSRDMTMAMISTAHEAYSLKLTPLLHGPFRKI